MFSRAGTVRYLVTARKRGHKQNIVIKLIPRRLESGSVSLSLGGATKNMLYMFRHLFGYSLNLTVPRLAAQRHATPPLVIDMSIVLDCLDACRSGLWAGLTCGARCWRRCGRRGRRGHSLPTDVSHPGPRTYRRLLKSE